MKKVRRTITPSAQVNAPKKGKTGAQRLWAFCVKDLGVLFDRGDEWVRLKIRSGELDPTNLESICRLWASKKVGKLPENSLQRGASGEGVFPREFSSPPECPECARRTYYEELEGKSRTGHW